MENEWLAQTISINSVRIGRADLGKILNWLDRGEADAPQSKREHERYPYRMRGAVVYVKQGESLVAFTVPTRNVSAGGLAFLHGQMMYVGQSCVVHLATKDGQWLAIDATVVRCRHIRAMIHEIGLKFTEPIDVSRLRDVQTNDQLSSSPTPQPSSSEGQA